MRHFDKHLAQLAEIWNSEKVGLWLSLGFMRTWIRDFVALSLEGVRSPETKPQVDARAGISAYLKFNRRMSGTSDIVYVFIPGTEIFSTRGALPEVLADRIGRICRCS